MRVNLICTENLCPVLKEFLEPRGIILEPEASVSLVERGLPLPEAGLVIVFDPQDFKTFLDFIDAFDCAPEKRETGILLGKKEEGFTVIRIKEVCYFFAAGNYVYAKTADKKFELKQKLYELEENYAFQGLARVSKSYLVNIMKIEEIIPWFGGRLLLRFKGLPDEIEVSRNYAKAFKQLIRM